MSESEIKKASRYAECHAAVSRQGQEQPCDKTAVAIRSNPDEESAYPVCAFHAREPMVPLAEVLRAHSGDIVVGGHIGRMEFEIRNLTRKLAEKQAELDDVRAMLASTPH